jgi:hypothetical protein
MRLIVVGSEGMMFDSLVKFVLRTLALLCAASAVAAAFMATISIADGKGEALGSEAMMIAFSAAMAAVFWRWSGAGDRERKERDAESQRIITEAVEFFENVNTHRGFAPAQTDRIICQPDDPILAACNAKLFEVSTSQVRQYLGTRVKIGGLPIYLGQSTPQSRTVIKESATGELALTPTRLIFNGTTRSANVELKKIIALDIARDGITVSISGRQKPLLFIVPNGLLWGQLVKNLMQLRIKGLTLPEGATLQIT